MFIVTNRDLQVRMKEIRTRVNEGDDAIYHGRNTDDLVIVSLKRYNQMLEILYKGYEDAKDELVQELERLTGQKRADGDRETRK